MKIDVELDLKFFKDSLRKSKRFPLMLESPEYLNLFFDWRCKF